MRDLLFAFLIALAGFCSGSSALAQVCTALTTTVAPASATLPTYSPIGIPTTFTLGVRVTNNSLAPCPIALTFNGPSSPAVMTSGGSQLSYTIKDSSDATTLLYVGAAPGSNVLSTVANVGTTDHRCSHRGRWRPIFRAGRELRRYVGFGPGLYAPWKHPGGFGSERDIIGQYHCHQDLQRRGDDDTGSG